MTQQQAQAQSPAMYEGGAAGGVRAGRFVWHDLMSTDPERSRAFYTELLGWTTRTMPMGGAMGDYVMVHVGDEGIGGIVPLDPAHGAPSHWIGYVSVDGVDAACERAAAAGGEVCVPATDIPNTGRFAVVADPAGAVISPFGWLPEQAMPEREGGVPVGHFCWDELVSSDPEASMRFNAAVFGWRYEAMDMGPMGTYHMAWRGDTMAAGLMQLPAEAQAGGARSHWVSYVMVANVDQSVAHATELGASVLVPPRDIPDMGRFSVLMDPVGAVFALFQASAQ